MKTPLIYKDKPLFGLDIGFSTMKVMQIEHSGKQMSVDGYGITSFDPTAIVNGVIVDFESVAKAAKSLFDTNVIGSITTRRAAATIPVARVYNRSMRLPKLKTSELDKAVSAETEQYVPIPLDDLYIDYEIVGETENEYELLVVAAPRKIVDSYITLFDMLDLELVALETSISSSGRLVRHAERQDVPTILMDFGSVSVDLTIFDGALIVTGTVAGGGDTFTGLIADTLGVSKQVAHTIKTKYGLDKSKKQQEVRTALQPQLDSLLKEIRKMIRYYEERDQTQKKIGQVITMGGGANMPGLSEFLTDQLRVPARMCNPWINLSFADLQPPNSVEKSMYATVAGLALVRPKELFA